MGLIFPWEEDFGIVPIEVMSAGKPVFALWKWGLTETVLPWKTWDFFYDTNGKDFKKEFKKFHTKNLEWKYTPKNCIKQAQKFDKKTFETKILKLIKI